MGDKKLANRADAQTVEGKEDEETRDCDGRTALRDI